MKTLFAVGVQRPFAVGDRGFLLLFDLYDCYFFLLTSTRLFLRFCFVHRGTECSTYLHLTSSCLVAESSLCCVQNTKLQTRVEDLELCECRRSSCLWDGKEVQDGARWEMNGQEVCACTAGKVQCAVSDGESYPHLSAPCNPEQDKQDGR